MNEKSKLLVFVKCNYVTVALIDVGDNVDAPFDKNLNGIQMLVDKPNDSTACTTPYDTIATLKFMFLWDESGAFHC